MEVLKKEFAGLGCFCLELGRKRREVESCEFHQTLNASILGHGYPNLLKKFS